MSVPERFRKAVLSHCFAVSCLDNYPLLLAVVGPPGDGKSFQTAASLKAAGFVPFRFSSSELGGRSEGRPVEQLRGLYKRAAQHAEVENSFPVLVLEDFDLGPAGRDRNARYTVNSQLLTGFLMNLADDVRMCDVGTSRRFPIVLTTNDLSTLHGPLIRPGRMRVFSWEPNTAERAEMIYSALHARVPGLTLGQVEKLAARYPGLSVAAISSALVECLGDKIFDFLSENPQMGIVEARQRYANGVGGVTLDEIEDALQRRGLTRRRLTYFRTGGE
ncbi:AAA family ATPase [Micromonospora sp. WMMD1128]|uniref:AAA family ATPase n=1 Tax=Micromonospora sp. WMMD1128 TaxID=3015150 RepID=UPI00248AB828|nr:AAA family ATPase [Micromonospora sp. WMMD1128]WBB74324.1 AAA family ATPase [Micromonospora sp. WMMD1128]